MDAAVVELDSLADPVGPSSQNHDFFPVRHPGFIFRFIRGIIIGSGGLELGGARVHQLIDRKDTLFRAPLLDGLFV